MHTLVFFHARTCGHSRRMDSVVDHFLRIHRAHLRAAKVELKERCDLAARFQVTQAPSLLLLDERMREVARVEGRCTSPEIQRAFEPFIMGDIEGAADTSPPPATAGAPAAPAGVASTGVASAAAPARAS